MIRLIWLNFIRSGVVKIGLLLLFLAGILSILVGMQFSERQQKSVSEAALLQQEQFSRHVESFRDDIGYMLYYAKFSFVNSRSPLESFSIGQRDVNPTVLALTIRNIEAQKYDADLGNPYNQLIGQIDFSFVLIFLFPCLIIAWTYNLISEEQEAGTWNLVSIQAKSTANLVFRLLAVRLMLVTGCFIILALIASVLLESGLIELFWKYLVSGVFYIFLWFCISFFVISFRKSSNFNALTLLSVYLLLLIVLPAAINSFLQNKYPVPEALEVTVKQRKAYHEKWDMDKAPTMNKFFAHYPQYARYTLPPGDFSWPAYYAMQQMGDDESASYSNALREKLEQRNKISARIARFIPTLHLQFQLNSLAKSDLDNHLRFLDAATRFHERVRLHFYPKIFENMPSTSENWKLWKEEYFDDHTSVSWTQLLLPLILFSLLLAGAGLWRLRLINEAATQ